MAISRYFRLNNKSPTCLMRSTRSIESFRQSRVYSEASTFQIGKEHMNKLTAHAAHGRDKSALAKDETPDQNSI
jgi:hypothetical protein